MVALVIPRLIVAVVGARRPDTPVALLGHVGFCAARRVIRHGARRPLRVDAKRLLASPLPKEAI